MDAERRIRILAAAAAADGAITEDERALLLAFGRRLEVPDGVVEAILEGSRPGRRPDVPEIDDDDERDAFFRELVEVVLADAELKPSERLFVDKIGRALGIDHARQKRALAELSPRAAAGRRAPRDQRPGRRPAPPARSSATMLKLVIGAVLLCGLGCVGFVGIRSLLILRAVSERASSGGESVEASAERCAAAIEEGRVEDAIESYERLVVGRDGEDDPSLLERIAVLIVAEKLTNEPTRSVAIAAIVSEDPRLAERVERARRDFKKPVLGALVRERADEEALASLREASEATIAKFRTAAIAELRELDPKHTLAWARSVERRLQKRRFDYERFEIRNVAIILGELGDEEADLARLRRLAASSRDDDELPVVAVRAIAELGARQPAIAADALVTVRELAADPDLAEVELTTLALAAAGDPAAAETLRRWMAAADPSDGEVTLADLRGARAAMELHRLGEAAAGTHLEAVVARPDEDIPFVLAALFLLDERPREGNRRDLALPALRTALDEGGERHPAVAVGLVALGEAGDLGDIRRIAVRLAANDRDVRCEAAAAILRILARDRAD